MPARRKRRAPKALLASSEEETDIEGDVLPPTPPEAFVSKKVWGAGEARTKNKTDLWDFWSGSGKMPWEGALRGEDMFPTAV
ncbi:hypothetical protein DPEC_G00226420 [Dallia pectoralis]|uniref:Uncharacterized protein n=1 Tax=Dallia pectoralis TaxID=75939 RepID=A0ACC2G0D6_DALPE|nr:hypothetical protein DPEC_G00226420 [Dallia pectoralis]